jgi:hypothetical protein
MSLTCSLKTESYKTILLALGALNYRCKYIPEYGFAKNCSLWFSIRTYIGDVQQDNIHFLAGAPTFLPVFHSDALQASLAVCAPKKIQHPIADLYVYTFENDQIVLV